MRMRAIGIVVAAVLAATATTGVAGAAPAAPATIAEIEAEIAAYQAAHPGDYVGLDALQQRLGFDPMIVQLEGSDEVYTAREAQALDVPGDAFSVSITGAYYPDTDQWRMSWNWDFRDDYVNGSDPEDISNLQVDPATCYNRTSANGTFLYMYQYDGVQRTEFVISDPGLSQPNTVVNIDDSVSGFVTNFDHGNHVTYFEKSDPACAGIAIRAAYNYEHNQDGGGITGISVGWGFLTITYEGGPAALRQSTQVFQG